MRAQCSRLQKWRLHQELCNTIVKKEKRFWSDNKYVLIKYISINQEWRG